MRRLADAPFRRLKPDLIANLKAQDPDLLLMDEPTTHLDIHSIEGLTQALLKYEGTLVFISHDVHFIRSVATKVLHINNGVVTPYAGGYDYFMEKTGALDARAAVTAS